jgi:hypothetical protein
MENESASNPDELMNTDYQLDSTLCFSGNHDLSFGNTLKYRSSFISCFKINSFFYSSTEESIGVKVTSSLLEGALFIVSNGTYEVKNIPNYWKPPVNQLMHTFDNVAILNDHPENFVRELIKAYADLYNIDLHVIVYYNNKYIIIDKTNFSTSNEEQCNREIHAYIWCNNDNTRYYPLYINDINGHKRTVFELYEVFVSQRVKSFVDQINQKCTFYHIIYSFNTIHFYLLF